MSTKTTPIQEVPEWVNETPNHIVTTYCMQVENPDCTVDQEITMSRDEYEWLKNQLAVSRGLLAPTDKECKGAETPTVKPAAEPEESNQLSITMESAFAKLQTAASYIERTIELYKKYPRPEDATELLADAFLLESILSDWRGNEGMRDEDGDSQLVGCIKLNLGI